MSQVARTPGDMPTSALLILAEEASEEKELNLRSIFFFFILKEYSLEYQNFSFFSSRGTLKRHELQNPQNLMCPRWKI